VILFIAVVRNVGIVLTDTETVLVLQHCVTVATLCNCYVVRSKFYKQIEKLGYLGVISTSRIC